MAAGFAPSTYSTITTGSCWAPKLISLCPPPGSCRCWPDCQMPRPPGATAHRQRPRIHQRSPHRMVRSASHRPALDSAGQAHLKRRNERVNRSFQRGAFDAKLLRSLVHVRQPLGNWLLDHNTLWPHQPLNFMAPLRFKQAA